MHRHFFDIRAPTVYNMFEALNANGIIIILPWWNQRNGNDYVEYYDYGSYMSINVFFLIFHTTKLKMTIDCFKHNLYPRIYTQRSYPVRSENAWYPSHAKAMHYSIEAWPNTQWDTSEFQHTEAWTKCLASWKINFQNLYTKQKP